MRTRVSALCVLVLVSSIAPARPSAARRVDTGAGTSARIARIEAGLLPAVTIKGRPSPAMRLADRMEAYNVPGLSIAFVERGKVAWTRTYGYADVARRAPVTDMTLFAAASVSKPLTALAALRLVQGGKLSLDEDVNARLRSWKVPESDLTRRQKVTLRGLLSHTAGIANQVFKGYAPTDPLPSVAQILRGESPASSTPVVVETVPGTAQQYSNAGYLIVQQLLTDVTGMPFPEILKGSVLGPTGMRRSTFEQPLPGKWRDAAATGYRADGSPVESRIVPFMAPAGLWTTPSDMARLIIELQAEYAGESARILSPQTAREMLPREGGSLPLGFHTISAGRSPIFGHKGHIDGFGCEVEALTDRQEGVVVMTNGDRGNGLAEEVIRAVAAEYEWPALRSQEHSVVEVNPAALSRYVGRYELPGRDTLSITLSGGRLLLQSRALGGEPRELLAESDTRFFLLDPAVVFEFRQSPDGAVTGLGVEVNGQVHEARVVR